MKTCASLLLESITFSLILRNPDSFHYGSGFRPLTVDFCSDYDSAKTSIMVVTKKIRVHKYMCIYIYKCMIQINIQKERV